MTLRSGARLGPYEIMAPIGRGGMGEVYRANDVQLRRQVALKVIPEAFAADEDRLARFAREAEILAQLNHPNIAQIYSLERSSSASALVMELVDGMTLAQRILQGPIPVGEALATARQIAEAVEAAHLGGIIHRDLKPANVKLREDGVVKVLDFGLAKALHPSTSPVEASDSSTTTMTRAGATRTGAVMGTAPYMSPEQASGLAVDRGADIWAFGCVLFEMLSGRRAFEGDDVTTVIGAVLRSEPDWSRLPREAPAAIRTLLRRCLEKDKRRRLVDMRDARFAIEDAAVEPPGVTRKPEPTFRKERVAWGVALALALAGAAALLGSARRAAPPQPAELRVEITTPPTSDLASIALSPDGEKIVFVASSQGRPMLWLRSLVTAESRSLPGTAGALFPFWSPDSRAIGFFANGRLYRIGVDGGSLVELALAPVGAGGTWSGDGVIVYARVPGGPPLRMADTGGGSTAIPAFEVKDRCSFPLFLPDGRRFLYYGADGQGRGVFLAGLDGSGRERLFASDSAAVFLAPDRVAFVRAGALLEQRLDMASLRPLGDPVAIASGVVVDNLGVPAVSASSQGWIAYRTGIGTRRRRLVRLDRSGRQVGESFPADSELPQNLSLSADGRRLLLQRSVHGNFDLWILDVDRRALTRLTSSPSAEVMPVFSPRGDRVAFGGAGRGAFDLWQLGVAGKAEPTLAFEGPLAELPLDWSRDGRFLLFQANTEAGEHDIWALAMEGDQKPFPVAEGPGTQTQGVFSPDGRWVAYESDETGRREVYLQPFPGPGDRLLVSTQGGGQPQWRPDGRELYYVASDGHLTALPLRFDAPSGAVEAAAPVPLFLAHLNTGRSPASRQEYVVAPDRTFLINGLVEEEAAPITLVLRQPL